MQRAYSLLTLKSLDDEQRLLEGIATTPSMDRSEDIVESSGAVFHLPLPLLWQHGSDPFVGRTPVGHVIAATPRSDGIPVRIQMARTDEPGRLRDILDFAWQAVAHQLVRGLSIGFHALEPPEAIKGTFGFRYKKWEWVELSAVTIPANSAATITTIKAIAAQDLTASGQGPVRVVRSSAGVAAVSRAGQIMKKTFQEQITEFEATRAAKDAERVVLMTKAADAGETLDAAAAEQYDTLTDEIRAVDAHLKRLRDLEESNQGAARPVAGASFADGAASRAPVIQVKETLPPGHEFARMVMCKAHAYLEHMSPVELAKARYPDSPRIHQYLQRGAVPAATTGTAVWAGALVDPTNLAGEFIEFLRPQTIIGKFGTGGIPSLRRVPFNVRVIGQISGGEGYWVGQGAPKPLTSFQVAPTTLTWAKVANIAVLTEEIVRFSSPSAEALVRDELARALIERLDVDFVDPAKAASANVSPASITNGLTALTSAGTGADNARTDLQNLLETFILANIDPTSLVLIMPNTLALALSLMVNSLGQAEFPGLTMRGGTLQGIPVITSQYAANQSGGGNLVIAVNASDIFLSDDGQVTIDMSREASLEMLDNPTNNSATSTATSAVSMWQTNSIALRAERFINWAKRRADAVAYMDDVNWGSIGSPS